MKILVLGTGGMAGHLVAIYLREKGHRVTGFSKTPLSYCENIVGNALDKKTLEEAVTCEPFDAVINCIGVLNKEVDNHIADGIFLNSYLPHFIVDCLKDTKTKFIHLSTDCVFLGKSGAYGEDDFKDSDTFYGRTKALGEINDTKNLTIRTSIIGPDRKENGVGLLNWFLKQDGSVNGFTSAIWTGVSTITLAQAIERALEEDLCGLYHLVNNQTISKFELLQLFNCYLKKEQVEILSDDSVHVDKSLINNRKDFNFIVPSYEQMIKDTRDWIFAHKELYPHYF
ncbi:MAG: sugar nucleotide-binding protein [Anaeromicrobium sp.]|jgi:dTDP-4-dehydrorhamnose reductase|uniref:SDR family oxidoreductase n=1 Tax=Anaeromicrobium sp. TaxID=1929132 RepID=UPI0025E0DC20|nr:sugar nucleotide-binding protein [Anaeromicrobium sp.]MCT4592691.1 sugar nucleotide-binding protein [Anaeromicrobium sp.]